MGFELPLDDGYSEHPKTLHLMNILGNKADCYPIRMWCWATKYAKKGKITVTVDAFEAGLKWQGKRGQLHKALVRSGFIEKNGKTIHNWMDRTGRSIALYEAKKRKQREEYALRHGILPEESGKNDANPEDSENSGKPGGGGPLAPELQILKAMATGGIPGTITRKREYARALDKRLGLSKALEVLRLDENQGISLLDIEDKYLRDGKTAKVSRSLSEFRKEK